MRTPQALTHRVVALVAAGVAVLVVGSAAVAAKPHKPPKPHPTLTLMTGTEEGVLSRKEIKVRVETDRGNAATVTNHFVVEGYPSDFPFDLPAQRKKLRDKTAVAHFPLSQRQLEVLDFAIKTCRSATVSLNVTVGRGTGSLAQSLQLPAGC
jgi:hypothetical protein